MTGPARENARIGTSSWVRAAAWPARIRLRRVTGPGQRGFNGFRVNDVHCVRVSWPGPAAGTELGKVVRAAVRQPDVIHSPAHFCKADLSELTTLVNFLFPERGQNCIENSDFPF